MAYRNVRLYRQCINYANTIQLYVGTSQTLYFCREAIVFVIYRNIRDRAYMYIQVPYVYIGKYVTCFQYEQGYVKQVWRVRSRYYYYFVGRKAGVPDLSGLVVNIDIRSGFGSVRLLYGTGSRFDHRAGSGSGKFLEPDPDERTVHRILFCTGQVTSVLVGTGSTVRQYGVVPYNIACTVQYRIDCISW